MKKFFICTDGIAKGPYMLEDLLSFGLTEKDLIWSRDWGISKYAFEIEELKGYFRKSDLHLQPAHHFDAAVSKTNSTVVKNTILFSLLFVLAGLIIYYFININ